MSTTKNDWKTMRSKPVDRSKRIAPGAEVDAKHIVGEKARTSRKATNYKNLNLGLKTDAPQRIQKKRSTPPAAPVQTTYKRNRKSITVK